MKPTISIVMTYYERYEQLTTTLRSFILHGYDKDDIEVIVVDDASIIEPLNCERIALLPFPVHVITMPKAKEYSNPCIPFNVGFRAAQGEIIIIQNAECLHFSNVIEYVKYNLKANDYISFACYSLNKENTEKLFNNSEWTFNDIFKNINNDKVAIEYGDDAWYNHSKLRPKGYHFCSAITKSNLNLLKGFDERYSSGIAFDDDEFLYRIKRSNLSFSIIDSLTVVHQWHYSGIRDPQYISKFCRNGLLFHCITKKEKGYYNSSKSIKYKLFNIFYPLGIPFFYVLLSVKKIMNKVMSNIKNTYIK